MLHCPLGTKRLRLFSQSMLLGHPWDSCLGYFQRLDVTSVLILELSPHLSEFPNDGSYICHTLLNQTLIHCDWLIVTQSRLFMRWQLYSAVTCSIKLLVTLYLVMIFEFQWKFLLFRHRTQEDSSFEWPGDHSCACLMFITHCNVALCILNAVVPSDEWTSLQIGVRSSD